MKFITLIIAAIISISIPSLLMAGEHTFMHTGTCMEQKPFISSFGTYVEYCDLGATVWWSGWTSTKGIVQKSNKNPNKNQPYILDNGNPPWPSGGKTYVVYCNIPIDKEHSRKKPGWWQWNGQEATRKTEAKWTCLKSQ